MMASLARLYEVRNILTHELPAEAIFDTGEIPVLADATKAFVGATDWVVVEALHNSVPRTQVAMNMHADDYLNHEKEAIAREICDVESLNGVDQDFLYAMQAAWERFADLQASFVASQVDGGSMHSMIWASEKAACSKERVDQLARIRKEWIDT